jgi:2-haloacid dehalogenase
MPDLRAILFDTFGTVVDWRSSLITDLTAFGAGRGIAADWVGLVDKWRAAYAPSMDRVRRGELPWTKLDDLHRASLDQLVSEAGIEGLTEVDRVYLTNGWHRLHAWPDSVAGTERLHRRYITGPLSNGNVSLLVDLARFNDLRWDVIFGAEVSGHYKPDPETYLGACRMLSLQPGEVMLCAAHNSDLQAAQSHGMQTAFVARPTEYGPAQVRDTKATGDWDYVVDGIDALADRLGV